MTGAQERLSGRVSVPVIGIFALTTLAVAALVDPDVEISNIAAVFSTALVAILVLAVATGIEFRHEHPYPVTAVLWRLSPLVFATGLSLFVVLALPENEPRLPPPARRSQQGGSQTPTPSPRPPRSDVDPHDVIQYTVMVLAALAILAFIGWLLWERAKRRRDRPAPVAAGASGQAVDGSDVDEHELEQQRAVREALERSRIELLAESDPRLAVIRAYVAFESHVGSQGMAREPAETQREYIARVLSKGRLAAPDRAPQLVELFNTARFSTQPVTAADARSAQGHIDALVGD